MKSVSSLLNTDCEIYSLCIPSWMLKSIINTYLFKMLSLVLRPSAQLFQSAVNTLENTLRSNPVKNVAIITLFVATKITRGFPVSITLHGKEASLRGCFPRLLLYIQYLTEAIHQEQIMVFPSKLAPYL